jgi:hypothetical protein
LLTWGLANFLPGLALIAILQISGITDVSYLHLFNLLRLFIASESL